MEIGVVIVGAGPSGLATSVCLSILGISHVIFEKEDCYASLWKKRSYDRLNLHLAKEFCALPHMPHSSKTPKFLSKDEFVQYLDSYVEKFNIKPVYHHSVENATYDDNKKCWKIEINNVLTGSMVIYESKFLVVATGENGEKFIPNLLGLDSFPGEIIHSSEYKFGLRFKNMKVLVVGCGNSGMEISYDLQSFGADTSIVIRNPFHVCTKEMIYMGMSLLKYFPMNLVDRFITLCSWFVYGNLSKYGIHRPRTGPFLFKILSGKTPVIDVGTIGKIKCGDIKVLPEINEIKGHKVFFRNGSEQYFDVIIFATGYKSVVKEWLKDFRCDNGEGLTQNGLPKHWKGQNGIYYAGFSGRGLNGVSVDARNITTDILMRMAKV